jgi:hypothetical protein
MEWRDILELLEHNRGPLAAEARQQRPHVVRPSVASTHRLIFVEQYRRRRLSRKADRWNQPKGGRKGALEHWISSRSGIRCRYGWVERLSPDEELWAPPAMHEATCEYQSKIRYTLFTRLRYDSPSGQVVEDKYPQAYVVEQVTPAPWDIATPVASTPAQAPPVPTQTPERLGDALERVQLEQLLAATAAEFERTVNFDGARDGYVFKLGPKGAGYYLDEQRQQEMIRQMVDEGLTL